MGACLSSFKKKRKRRNFYLHRCRYNKGDKVEIDLLMDGEETDTNEDGDYNIWTMSGRIPAFIFKKKKEKGGFQRLEKQPQKNETLVSFEEKDDTQLLPLDAHTLLASRALQRRKFSCSSSTPPSSIDLEWENEGILASTSFHRKRLPSCNLEEGSSESGMGGTSPESLEWDPCDQTGTDLETEQLISEIERLTSRALCETGDWTNR